MNAAIDVAKGLADLHGLGSEGQSAIIHSKLNIEHVHLLVKSIFSLMFIFAHPHHFGR
jgi:hypothetical protein